VSQINPRLTHDCWTPYEDAIVLREQAMRGNSWTLIVGFVPGRSAMSVKNRCLWLTRHRRGTNPSFFDFERSGMGPRLFPPVGAAMPGTTSVISNPPNQSPRGLAFPVLDESTLPLESHEDEDGDW
jgi:hypothetical protein